MTTKIAGRIATAGIALALTTIGARAETIELPTFDVVATTPLGGGQINVSQSPFAVWQTSAQDMQTFNDTTLPDALARSAPGVTVGNVSGNEFEPDLSYRGFDATAVTGTPQGLAVYQNGTRINEALATSSTGTSSQQMRSTGPRSSPQTRSSASTRLAAPSR
jgi:iron complex outermembrane recepter protein